MKLRGGWQDLGRVRGRSRDEYDKNTLYVYEIPPKTN